MAKPIIRRLRDWLNWIICTLSLLFCKQIMEIDFTDMVKDIVKEYVIEYIMKEYDPAIHLKDFQNDKTKQKDEYKPTVQDK